MKKLVNDDFTIPISSVQQFRVINATNNETKKIDWLVIAVLNGNTDGFNLDNPNVVILNLDETNLGFEERVHAIRFKEILENRIDNNFEQIYLLDILDDVRSVYNLDKNNKPKPRREERKSTMVDVGKIPPVKPEQLDNAEVNEAKKPKTRELS